MEGGSWEKELEKKRKSERREEGKGGGWEGEIENEYSTLLDQNPTKRGQNHALEAYN